MIKSMISKSGKTIYTMSNSNGMEVDFIELGAIIVSIRVPDKNGNKTDVVLGYEDLDVYDENPCFFGCCVGPIANRTKNASFSINGKKYSLPVNEGVNNLHTDFECGLHKRMFTPVIDLEKDLLIFTIQLEDMEYGIPGNRKFTVTYELSDDNTLSIAYEMLSDKDTAISPTNHTYFNLGGIGSGDILDTVIEIASECYTPVDSGLIPDRIATVEGTPFDFRIAKKISQDFECDNEQLKYGKGYDHNFVVKNNSVAIARATDNNTGIVMEVFTDLPGVQFYTGNNIGYAIGKEGKELKDYYGFCFETQYFPNSLNDDRFDSPIVKANEKFYSKTSYKFSIDK